MTLKRFLAAALILSVTLLCACAEPAGLFDSDSKSLTEPDMSVLRIASAPENEPFVYTGRDGELLGFDPALGMLIAERMGLKPVFYSMSENTLLNSLNCGMADIVVSAVEISDDLRRIADFSKSYITIDSSIVTNGNNQEVRDTGSLSSARSVGAVYGTMPYRYLTAELGLTNISEYRSTNELIGAMLRGDIDVMFCDSRDASAFTADYPLFAVREFGIDRHSFSVAVADGDSQMARRINGIIEEFKSDNTLLNLRRAYINGADELKADFNSRLSDLQREAVTAKDEVR